MAPEGERQVTRSSNEPPDRRRPGWGEYRRQYKGILSALTASLVLMAGFNGWLVYKGERYKAESVRLRAGMSESEVVRTDLLLASSENRTQIILELVRRQAQSDVTLNLSVSLDSGVMHLQRDGAELRTMRIEIGRETTIGIAPDTVLMASPRGMRSIESVMGADDTWVVPEWVYVDRGLPVPETRSVRGALGPNAVVTTGGAIIYTLPAAGPLADSTYVMPGSIRVIGADLKALFPNLKPGIRVYYY